jgi:hypothetical protein
MDIYSPERNTQLVVVDYINEKPYLFRIGVDVTTNTTGQRRYSARLLSLPHSATNGEEYTFLSPVSKSKG